MVNRTIIVFFISHTVSLVVSEETKQLLCGESQMPVTHYLETRTIGSEKTLTIHSAGKLG